MVIKTDEMERKILLRIERNIFRITEHFRICHEKPLAYEGRVKVILSSFKALEDHGSSHALLYSVCEDIADLIEFLKGWNIEDVRLKAFVLDRTHKYDIMKHRDMTL